MTTNERLSTTIKIRLSFLVLFLLPFLVFYWMIPFIGDLTLGTDYINYHIHHHLEMMFSIKTGSFPLYAPECFYGQSAAAHTQAQLYHPLAWLATLMPGYWQGYSLDWITLFRLLSLGCCQALLFTYLLKLRVNPRLAFIISLITVYNHRTLALFWHGCALEAYTGMLLLCIAAGMAYLEPQKKRHALIVIFAMYWLVTSGYPPMVYFGLAGVVLFVLIIPFFTRLVLTDTSAPGSYIFSFWIKIFVLAGVGFLMSAAYLMPLLFDLMPANDGRVNQPYLWSTAFTDKLVGFFNNFFNSLQSGSGMFGGSPLFLTATVIPVAVLLRYKIPKTIWLLISFMVLIFFYMQGDRLPVHYWIWKTFPLASCIRGPGRASMVLPLIFMLLITWMFTLKPDQGLGQHRILLLPLYSLLALIAFLLTAVYIALPDQWFVNTHYTSPCNVRNLPQWINTAVPITGLMILGLFVLRPVFGTKKPAVDYMIIILTIIQIILIMRHGPYAISQKYLTPTYDQMLAEKKESINFQNVLFLNGGIGSRTVIRQLRNYFMEPRLAKIYRKTVFTDTIEQTYSYLNEKRGPDEVVVENVPRRMQKTFATSPPQSAIDYVKLTYSSYNRLVFKATAAVPSFFVLGYPHSKHWHAWLNNEPAELYRANGAALAIYLPAGSSKVEFRYQSDMAFAGMLISCLMIVMVIIIISRKMRANKHLRNGLIFSGVVAGAGVFFLWYHSLYTGQNLLTRYEWHSAPPTTPPNIAFGKPTRMSSFPPGYPYRYNSRHAVDGDRTVTSCFLTAEEENPWWMIDLKGIYTINRVVLYKSFSGSRFNRLPLTFAGSKNGKTWQVTSIDQLPDQEKLQIDFEHPQTFRYIRITANSKCVLTLNEVEVYSSF